MNGATDDDDFPRYGEGLSSGFPQQQEDQRLIFREYLPCLLAGLLMTHARHCRINDLFQMHSRSLRKSSSQFPEHGTGTTPKLNGLELKIFGVYML
jgi:hypothetical protein